MIKKLCIATIFIFCASAYCETANGGFYLSTKYQLQLTASAVGGNVEFSYVGPGRFGGFAGVDFGGGGKGFYLFEGPDFKGGDFGGGVSFGTKIQPADWFTAVLGGSGGCWAFQVGRKRYPYFPVPLPPDLEEEMDYEWVKSEPFFAVGGPFFKLLFGSKRIRYEFSSRVLFCRNYAPIAQIATGATFALGKKDK